MANSIAVVGTGKPTVAQTVKELLDLEKAISAKIAEVKTGMRQAVRDTKPLNGVKEESYGTLRYGIVNFSAFNDQKQNQNKVLATEYFLQSSQADLVCSAIDGAPRMEALFNRLKTLVAEKRVRKDKVSYPLNPNTVEVLEQIITEMEESE